MVSELFIILLEISERKIKINTHLIDAICQVLKKILLFIMNINSQS